MNKVVFIGNFSGDSFGCGGDPFRTCPFYALSEDMEAFATGRDGVPLIAFDSKAEAERRLANLARTAVEEAATARQVRTDRQHRLALGQNLRAAIERHTGQTVRSLRWHEEPRPTGGLDAVADGRTFRVWLGGNGQTIKIVELTSKRPRERV